MSDELKPCPFCGEEAAMAVGKRGDGSPWHYVECHGCGAVAEVTEEWNKRTESNEITHLKAIKVAGVRGDAERTAESIASDYKAWMQRDDFGALVRNSPIVKAAVTANIPPIDLIVALTSALVGVRKDLNEAYVYQRPIRVMPPTCCGNPMVSQMKSSGSFDGSSPAIYAWSCETCCRSMAPPKAGSDLFVFHVPLDDLVSHLTRQRDFSLRTFGPGQRTGSIIDHIRKELGEIQNAPTDLSEWIDVVLLAFDGAWRAGHEPAAIVAAMHEKQARNELRQWPDWRTAAEGRAIEHVREGGAP